SDKWAFSSDYTSIAYYSGAFMKKVSDKNSGIKSSKRTIRQKKWVTDESHEWDALKAEFIAKSDPKKFEKPKIDKLIRALHKDETIGKPWKMIEKMLEFGDKFSKNDLNAKEFLMRRLFLKNYKNSGDVRDKTPAGRSFLVTDYYDWTSKAFEKEIG